MPSAIEAYAAAQEAALRASAALATAMALAGGKVNVFTEVPANVKPPYVLIGEREAQLEQVPGCADEAELIATVQWWARKEPLDKGAQATAMGAAIVAALLAQLTLDGWDVDEWLIEQERYSTDPDQSTRGLAVFRYLLTAQA